MLANSVRENVPRGRLRGSALPEIVCDGCDGRGSARSRKASPTRRVYQAVCKKCGGKGRLGKTG
jgi:DnaJ-class molecular chaperone